MNRAAMRRLVAALLIVVPCAAGAALAEHPRVLITNAGREQVKAKIDRAEWSRVAYAELKARVDRYVDLCRDDPKYMSSRLFMNWQTRHTTPVVANSRFVRGEGQAPVPTPRFGGARDWATRYQASQRLQDLKPYNDQDGKVWLYNTETKQEEWAEPGQTGRMFEVVNERILETAADAGFVYWITGDEKYADYAAEILWTYMHGFSYVTSPNLPEGDRSMSRIIGMTSFEVIHEDIVTPLSVSYDFVHDHMKKQGRDVALVQAQLKRMIDRVIEGGGREGNWNLNQARIIAYGALALEEDGAYPDGKGRQHYIDIVLNAQLPAQTGLMQVVRSGFDDETALWPEAPGYGFGTTKDIVLIASLAGSDPAGRALVETPILGRAILAQSNLTYANGLSIGLGDTTNTRINAEALELLIAAARDRSDAALEQRLTAQLQREIASGRHVRSQKSTPIALARYVSDLPPVAQTGIVAPRRTFFGKPLDVVMQWNDVDDPRYSLAAAMYGTNGGHIHANGLSIELYGAGLILGADPGRGSSYWQADHSEYYAQPPAHNTVIVNGRSTYPLRHEGRYTMKIDAVEPPYGQQSASPNISFAQASFRYIDPVAADQQRTLAVVRTGPRSGFYFDVFRSRAAKEDGSFHDYLYHNIGQAMKLSDASGAVLDLSSSHVLTAGGGLMKGYDYFKNEKSAEHPGNLRATFDVNVSGTTSAMNVWVLGQQGRRVFRVDAPQNRAIRSELPAEFSQIPMPTLIVRQHGDAWRTPFVVVYEPYLGGDGPSIRAVRAARVDRGDPFVVACAVEGTDFTAYVVQNDAPDQQAKVEGHTFKGRFGAVIIRNGAVSEVYP